jgi:phenylacetate-CoA ligase
MRSPLLFQEECMTTDVMMWNKDAETMPPDPLAQLQLKRLREQVARVSQKVPFYAKRLQDAGVSADTIQSLDDLARIPFTTKSDLRDNYPFGLLTVPLTDIVRIHASSGTTGKPVVGPYTRNDMALWGEVMARTLSAGGVTRDDIVHNAYGYGLFTGGLGFALGAQTIGAAEVPLSGGLTKRQLMLMEDFGATVLCCTPSYALVIGEEAEADQIDVQQRMKLRVGFFGAEPWTDAMREEIEGRLRLEAYDIYGLTEVIGPGVAVECPYHDGMHINEDHFLAEVIDPDTGERLPIGSVGELVFTTLTREGAPVLRYRTRDRVRLWDEPCKCGRTFARMSKVLGRTDDMLKIKGVNVFPTQIEEALLKVAGLAPQYLIFVDRPKDQLDQLEIWVEATPDLWGHGEFRVKEVERKANEAVYQMLGIHATVVVTEPKKLERSLGKAVRVMDKRQVRPGQ